MPREDICDPNESPVRIGQTWVSRRNGRMVLVKGFDSIRNWHWVRMYCDATKRSSLSMIENFIVNYNLVQEASDGQG